MSWTAGQWTDAIAGAANEIATYALGFASATIESGTRAPDPALIGAHVALVGHGEAFDLAVVATPGDCAALARAMLASTRTDTLSAAEVADAVGEIANMLAGAVKRRMHRHGADLALGLPVFIRGEVQPSERVTVLAIPARLGPIPTHVLVIGRKQGEPSWTK